MLATYFLNIIKSLIFGVIEGITEWLPISSTGHLIIAEKFMEFGDVSDGFFDMFLVVIQLGAILAVVVMFWNKLCPFRRVVSDNGTKVMKVRKGIINLWLKVIAGCIPAGILGVLLDDLLDKYLYNYKTVAITLIIYGVLFIVVEFLNQKRPPKIRKLTQLTFKDALIMGAFQALALIPGTSRSGATILGGITFGNSRRVASEFSFFLAVPVMLGASALKLLKFGFNFSAMEFVILIDGMIAAFTISLLAIRLLMNYIKKHNFTLFGVYRIILGIIVLLVFKGA
ncbi:MAG: undecaprenyl-diphosphate phosphatase [Clostridia bacterium]|nr:undecaprenyl-diphosphate phosphatase [Clostridia bacterium]